MKQKTILICVCLAAVCMLLFSSCNTPKVEDKKDKAAEKPKPPEKIKFPDGVKSKAENQAPDEEVTQPQNAPEAGESAAPTAKISNAEVVGGAAADEAKSSFYEKSIRNKKADANAVAALAPFYFPRRYPGSGGDVENDCPGLRKRGI